MHTFFDGVKTIAIIGLSDKPTRPSYEVAAYLQSKGFRIIPINPTIKSVLGEISYPSLAEVPADIAIDVVDIFRRSEFVLPIVKDAVQRGDIKVIWMQEGIINQQAEMYARSKGLEVFSNFCLMEAHKRHAS